MLNRERFISETKNKIRLLGEKLKEEKEQIINFNEIYEKINLAKINQGYFNEYYYDKLVIL